MRKLASVQKIINVRPIENADSIEVAQVLGWECVVKKSDGFKIGDLVVYIEVDSIVPDRPEFEFLRDRKFRIKTIKLRGQVSQGLVLPLSILLDSSTVTVGYKEGDDVTAILGVKKHDPQAEAEQKMMEEKLKVNKNRVHKFFSKYSWYRNLWYKLTGAKKAAFPKFIKKTDEDRIQLFPNICDREKDTVFTVTEKLDGQSATYFLIKNTKRFLWFGKKYIFGVCSRNLQLTKPDNSSYWTVAKQYNLECVLKDLIGNHQFVVLQGEIIGDKIQGNKYKVSGYEFYAFNLIYDGVLINSELARDILIDYCVPFVPILDTNFKLKDSISDCVEYAKGYSVIIPTLREGVVVRNGCKNISFKIINPDFLLKNDE